MVSAWFDGLAVTIPSRERGRQAESLVRGRFALPAASSASTRPPVAAAPASIAEAGPSLLRARFVNRQRAALELFSIEGVDGLLSIVTRAHLHETEAARLGGKLVRDDSRGLHRPVLGEELLELAVSHGIGQTAHVQFLAHVLPPVVETKENQSVRP